MNLRKNHMICLFSRYACLVLFLVLTFFYTISTYPDILPEPHALDSLARLKYRLFEENKRKGCYDEALANLKEVALLRDSIIARTKARQLEQLKARYEIDKRNNEVSLLQQENKLKVLKIKQNRYISGSIAGLAVLISIIFLQLIRQRKFKTARHKLAIEQVLLRSQMNPHFIFNTLTNIQSFIHRNDPEKAVKYLDSFSGLISSILEISGKKEITLQTEIDMLTAYFKLQQLRYGDKLSYIFNIDPGLDPGNILIPPMMIQPLIENAIDHGIKPKMEGGRVDVRFMKQGTGLVIEVEDNGVGRQFRKEGEAPGKSSHAGLALVILKERLESLNKGRFKGNCIEITDLYHNENLSAGTLVRLNLHG